jgi:formaldehyde-activating enzyme involved in methanogenesis
VLDRLAVGDQLVDRRLALIITIWLDERCGTDENLDRKDLYRTNYEATKLAIARAMKGIMQSSSSPSFGRMPSITQSTMASAVAA